MWTAGTSSIYNYAHCKQVFQVRALEKEHKEKSSSHHQTRTPGPNKYTVFTAKGTPGGISTPFFF